MQLTVKPTPPTRTRLGVGVVLAVALASMSTPALASNKLNVKDNVHVKLVKTREDTLIETGTATGTLPGTVKISLTIRGFKATSTFTIYTKSGSISGGGSGSVKGGKNGYESFGGRLRVTGGTGHYHGATGTGGLYGTLYRGNESITAQVSGQLHL